MASKTAQPQNLRYVRDISLSDSTKKGYKAALSLFDHFLVHVLHGSSLESFEVVRLNEEVEDILTGYSLWLCDTNIPKNYDGARDNNKKNDKQTSTATSYMAYSGLKEYLHKTILVLKNILPNNSFLNDDEELDLISGKKFEKACKRSQANKSDTFGVESKVGLYREARHGGADKSRTPHWTCLVNCDVICRNMMNKTKTDDTYNDLTAKRAALVLNKHAVGRGGEFKHLNVKQFTYNPFMDCLDTTWTESKTIQSYSCPFVPNKYGYATDAFHALGCYMACGKGLFRQGNDPDNCYLFPRLTKKIGSGAARWLTEAIRKNLPEQVPIEYKNTLSTVSLRIAGVTEMAAADVGFWSSHARSGHSLPSNQDKYWDRDDVVSSLTAAKCLAGWSNFHAPVSID